MKNHQFSIGLLVVSAVSCSIHEVDRSEFLASTDQVFLAQMESAIDDDTKVFADDKLRVLWDADDRVSIFNKYTFNQEYRFTGETGANSGSFRKVESDEFITGNTLEYVYAVYPYRPSTSIDNDGVLSMTLPAEQSCRANSFGLGANAMVSCTGNNELLFKNLDGFFMLKLYGDGVNVTSISLKGNNWEPLAGPATVLASEDDAPSLTFGSGATQEISLILDTPVTLGTTAETATVFWLVVPPTTFSKGITLTVRGNGNGVFEKSTTKSLTVGRNKLTRMSALEVELEQSGIAASKYLTFTSEGTTMVSLDNYGGNAPVLYYSTDKTNWMEWDYSELTFTSGAPLYICGDNPEGFSPSFSKYSTFESSGDKFSVSGDVMSLINHSETVTAIPCDGCFSFLFYNCQQLVSPPELPATTLAIDCYSSMFSLCTSLTSAPELPATTMMYNCYNHMFYGCSSLTTAPELPATALADECYESMFSVCTGLTTAPQLPAMVLANRCYREMFSGCTSLTTAPDLPATTLAEYCYAMMFQGCTKLTTAPKRLPATTLTETGYRWMFYECTSLVSAPELPATTLAAGCYRWMFYGCSSLTSAPDLPAPELANGCYGGMFSECTNLNYIKCLATDISADNCLTNWLSGVSSTGTFVKAPVMNDWPSGDSGIPTGWVVINDGDVPSGGNEGTDEEDWN